MSYQVSHEQPVLVIDRELLPKVLNDIQRHARQLVDAYGVGPADGAEVEGAARPGAAEEVLDGGEGGAGVKGLKKTK